MTNIDGQQPPKKIDPNVIIGALIAGAFSIVVACIAFWGDMVPFVFNRNTTDQRISTPTMMVNEMPTIVPTTFTIVSSPTSSVMTIFTLAQECQGVKVYLILDNLLSGIKQLGCSLNDNRLVILSNKDIDGLVNLTGRITGLAITESTICDWQWYTNINASPRRIKENCSFSIDLNVNNLENIVIENSDKSILFTIQIRK